MQTHSTPLPQPLWDSTASWLHYSEMVGAAREGAPVPDFLTICPSRTGTTWLAHHLGRHPGIYVPAEKELHYFDVQWRREGIESYHEHFRDAASRLKGESTPSYALLPATAIRTIQGINPRLKLIFLARRLPERAWSHTHHCCRHYEGVFRNRTAPLGELPAADRAADFLSDYALSSADYCGILRRWMAFFPSEQLHVRYFEDAVARPEAYFRELLGFLGVDGRLPQGDLHTRINEGGGAALPAWVHPFLENLFATQQTVVENFLESTFGLRSSWRRADGGAHDPIWIEDTPGGWRVFLHNGAFQGVKPENGERVQALFLHDLRRRMNLGLAPAVVPGLATEEDQRLAVVLQELGEDLATARVVHLGVLGEFNIVRWKRLFFGIRRAVGAVDITLEQEVLRSRWPSDDLLIAPSHSEVEAGIRFIQSRGA